MKMTCAKICILKLKHKDRAQSKKNQLCCFYIMGEAPVRKGYLLWMKKNMTKRLMKS